MADRRRPERAPVSGRSNEYFVPRDGIDREVITADICRYLGNDALVRPGVYENPTTRVRQEGYFINAYRNLTSAMIQDLKQDSSRWEQERRQSASRSNGYKESQTHESRQYYGPTNSDLPHPGPGYVSAPPMSSAQSAYDSSSQFPQSGYAQPSGGYGGVQPQYVNENNYHVAGAYVSGGHLAVDSSRPNVPVSGANVPASNAGYAQPRTTNFQDERGSDRQPYYAQPVSSSQQYASQQGDPVYGRAPVSVPATYQQSGQQYDSEYPPESRYPGPSGYGQPSSSHSMDGSYSPATANSRRNDRDREPDPREARRGRHHGR